MTEILIANEVNADLLSQEEANDCNEKSDDEIIVNHEDKEKQNVEENDVSTIKKKHYRSILDSDSEDEVTLISSTEKKSDSDIEFVAESSDKNIFGTSDSASKPKKFRLRIESDSDDDDEVIVSKDNEDDDESGAKDDWISKENPATTKISNSRISVLVDSESEYENANNSDHSSPKVKNKKKTTDRKKKVKPDKSNGKSQFSSLIDSDSEDETRLNGIKESFDQQDHNGYSEKKSKKLAVKRTGSARASKEEAMRVIHSETQRLIRNSEVSLPYHRPKQRSLQDFLNRKKFIPDLPEGLTTAAKVKMSSSIIGKVLVEKEKEAELFYKSSDSEDETTTMTPENFTVTEKPTALNMTTDEIAIEETQKITKNGVQSSHNKKEIIKQGAVDIGLPRKLFVDESRDLVENERSEDKENCLDDEDEDGRKEIEDLRKKIKEVKQGLREGNAPRKLFTTEFAEGVDSSKTKNDPKTLSNGIEANSEVEKDVEDDLKNMDEGIDSSEKMDESLAPSDEDKMDSEQNLPDSGFPDNSIDENSPDLVSMSTNDLEKELAETSNISETPFISNKEYAKLNQREKSSKPQEISAEKSDVEDDSDEPAFGHVYGLPPPDFEDSPKESFPKPNVSKIVPKLRGQPGMMIDLSDCSKPNKDGVKSLVDRFLRHTAVKKKPAVIDSPITVLHTEKTANGVQLIEEILPYKLPQTDDITDKELQKPGAKYARLKNDLMKKMAEKRTEEWKLKEQREKEDQAEDEDLIEDESDDDVKLADEGEEVSTESEPEEEDIIEEKEKNRKNLEFADEEAEVSGEEDVDDDDDDEEESMDINAEEKNDDENMSAEESDSGSKVLSPESTGNKTKRGRIIRWYDDDSNSSPEESQEKDVESPKKPFERTKTDVDMFEPENDGWLSDTETDFPPSQILPRDQADARSQLCKTPSTAINILRFVSPITQLTALNTLIDSPKDSPMSKDISERRLGTAEKTPIGAKESPILCDLEKRIGFQKKLFEDPSGTVNDDELMGLCSGKFTGMENEEREVKMDDMEISTNGKVTETQMMGLCSGSFPSRIPSTGKYCDNDEIVDENSQDMRLMLDDDSEASCDLENTKTSKTKNSLTLKVVSSDDDDDDSQESHNEERKKMVAKKKVQKLVLSDDEDASELSNVEEDDEEPDNHVKDKYVDYDSEENEIVEVPGVKNVAKGFFEAEAELSESEWGSDDEDERDLDKLEFEEADEEVFDETVMRNQIGKIHARQVQDDDQREVRMLQELLFDDGDLHTEGGGRERKFKWKNIDQLGEDGGLGPRADDADDNGDLEEENDLEWRKERLEREKFIEDKMKDATEELTDDMAVDSQIFKLGIKALKKSKNSQNSQMEPDPAAPVAKPIITRTVLDLVGSPSLSSNPRILHKAVTRGSFLARGDECLARLAVHIKHSSDTTIVTRKNPRNCVFTHISPSVAANNQKNTNFSTNEESAANSKAKKRKPTAGITPRSTKKAKLYPTRPAGKKLF